MHQHNPRNKAAYHFHYAPIQISFVFANEGTDELSPETEISSDETEMNDGNILEDDLEENVNIYMISFSELAINIVVDEDKAIRFMERLHEELIGK